MQRASLAAVFGRSAARTGREEAAIEHQMDDAKDRAMTKGRQQTAHNADMELQESG